MARRKKRSQGILKRAAGAPDLSPITSQQNNRYLDPNVRAREIREGDNPLDRFFSNAAAVEAWSQPVPEVK